MADNYSGATTAALVITGVTNALNGNLYRCRATNEYGAVASESAELTVEPTPPSECGCALFIPPLASPYADYATAEAQITDWVGDCVAYMTATKTTHTLAADLSTPNQVIIDSSISGMSTNGVYDSFSAYVSVTIAAGGSLSVDYSVGGTAIGDNDFAADATIFDCLGAFVAADSISGAGTQSGTFNFPSVTAAGTYIVIMSARGPMPDSAAAFTLDGDFTVAYTDALVANPVIALWDDSGTTRQLEACPRLLLPLFTESTDTWYADEAAASADIAASEVDCYGYITGGRVTDYTYSFASERLTASVSGLSNNAISSGTMAFSVNLVAGDSVTLTGLAEVNVTCSGGTLDSEEAAITITIFDLDGNLLLQAADITASAAIATATDSFTAPYTGRYIVTVDGSAAQNFSGECEPEADGQVYGEVTSSGDISANPIQALYEVGLDCPGRLDCP